MSASLYGFWPGTRSRTRTAKCSWTWTARGYLRTLKRQYATATWKRTYGHHPLMGFADHGSGCTGEPVAALLRPGNAGSNPAADHITATRLALAQLPRQRRRGRSTLIRTDSAGGTHEFVAWLAQRGKWLSYSVGMTITEQIHQAVVKVPDSAWRRPSNRAGRSATALGPPSSAATFSRADCRGFG